MDLIRECKKLIEACKNGELGPTEMPEDSNPGFIKKDKELRIAYFTLPMALNYQRDSFAMWRAALETYKDPETRNVFNVNATTKMSEAKLRDNLLKHKLALQPNKHTDTWKRISESVYGGWKSFEGMISASDNDFLKLKEVIQGSNKKGFPYLSGPKIFNYWSSILGRYAGVVLKNTEYIEIAVDTHILKCSVKLGVITPKEAEKLGRLEISERWREALKGSGISPADMHFVLWFWSRNGFIYKP
ncbi:MAG: hypothetical protein WC565_01265 [Parcubacteria group bacterium]